jgi:soluble lytic murein transglycosylase-like protein
MRRQMKDGPDVRFFSAGLVVVVILLWLAFSKNVEAGELKTRKQIERHIVMVAKAHGVDPYLALAIAEVESGMNPKMIGRIGEIGLFQLRPEYHRTLIGDVRANVYVAIRYLAKLKRDCAHYGRAFYICYNLGPNYRRRDGLPIQHPTLFSYYKKVEAARIRNFIAKQ